VLLFSYVDRIVTLRARILTRVLKLEKEARRLELLVALIVNIVGLEVGETLLISCASLLVATTIKTLVETVLAVAKLRVVERVLPKDILAIALLE
jgi:hypothetical protein